MAATRLNDRYRILRPLGAGADGTVWLAEDHRAEDALRALKLVTAPDAPRRARLAAEFGRLARLSHQNLLRVYDLEQVHRAVEGIPVGAMFFTAAYAPGEDPVTAIARAPVAKRIALTLDLVDQLAGALAHVHAAGLVHCDVKPGNISVRVHETGIDAVLLDLGVSAVRGLSGDVRGTPAYMAPEALAGTIDPRGDLYGLGATIHEVLTGRRAFPQTGPALVRAICDGNALPCHSTWAPPTLVDLTARLLSPNAADRASSAAVVLDDIARIRDAHDLPRTSEIDPAPPTLLPPRLTGRDSVVGVLRSAMLDIGRADAPRVVELVGPPGAGKRAIIDETLRRHQLEVAAERAQAISIVRGDTLTVAAALDGAPDTADEYSGGETASQAVLARWVNRQLARAPEAARKRDGLVLVLDRSDDERRDALLAAFTAAGSSLGQCPLLVIATRDAEPPPTLRHDGGNLQVPVPPLDPDDVVLLASSMLGRPANTTWGRKLAAACGGLPRLVTEAIRAAAGEAGVDGADQVSVASLASGHTELDDLLVRRVAALSPALCAVLEALAVHAGTASAEALADTLGIKVEMVHPAAAELATQKLVIAVGDALRLPSRAHADALHAAIPAARRKSLHRAALRWCDAREPPDLVAVAEHLSVTGPAKRAVEAAMEAASHLLGRGRTRYALRLLERAAEVATGSAAADVGLLIAELCIDTGAYESAITAASRATRSRDVTRRRRARLAIARAQQKSGDYASAETVLAKLVESDENDDESRGAYARLLVSRGEFERAIEIAGETLPEASASEALPRGACVRLEALALALLYRDQLPAAQAAVERLEASARAGNAGSALGKALGLRGMVAQWSGDLDEAAALYASAHEAAAAAGDLHAAAVYALNRGSVCSGRARYGEALVALDAATVALRRVGRVAELAGALFNRGIVLLRLGELDAARRAADDARALAAEYGTPQWQVYAHMLTGDVARRDGDRDAARASYDKALEHARALGGGRTLAYALINAAELAAEDGDENATRLIEEARTHASTDEDREACVLAHVRVTLSLGGDQDGTDPTGLVDSLAQAAARMTSGGSHDQAWRSYVVASRLAHAHGDTERAVALARSGRGTLDKIIAATQEARRAGLRSDPDALALGWLEAQLPGARPGLAPTETAPPRRDSEFRRLLTLSRRLNSELRLSPLLDQVMDTVIDLTGAERGFLLLRNKDSKQLDVVVARNFEQSELTGDELRVSRSIAERAAQSGDAVLTVDAGIDERFGAAASVAALRLRSVLAVPLRQKGRITGTIYVDHRFRRGVFDDDAILFIRELADIAAVAIENARLVEENRRRAEQIATLNRRLEDEVVEKETELANVRARLTSERRSGLRHAYEAIVGRSPAMLEMLRTLDRATETDLPVVILGDSGTGKELVARALHENGARHGEAFVAINCGAVPEALLESELFGHARGAFTGAARDRPGLFEVAHKGTLLLDEIADTSLAMQAKLLRVLQEREIRRVGESNNRQVDVRVIAASNQDLRHLVEEGRFREDLFYRLEVLRIAVPPLRDRIEDIPELANHILARVSRDGEPTRVTKAAFARLCGHPWPGNVRELENELVRAAALSSGAIDVADLSPRILAAPVTPTRSTTENLLLKPQVEALERALVEEALSRTHGNQTKAARLLGLSRYGLQKKLKRYGISGSV